MARPLTLEELNKFRREYFEQREFDYWKDRLFIAWKRHSALKRDKNKAKYIVDIYSIYVQTAEILIITMHSLTVRPEQFLHSLAIDNKQIREVADEIRKNDEYLRRFTINFVYKIRGREPTKKELDQDINMLKEILGDYLDDYSFLNSFKHGYRVHSKHGPNYMAFGVAPDKMAKVAEGDSQITYYDIKKSGGRLEKISERTISFKHMRVFGKTLYTIAYLSNVRLSELAALGIKRKVTYPIFYIHDQKGWSSSFGGFRLTLEKFIFPSQKSQKRNN